MIKKRFFEPQRLSIVKIFAKFALFFTISCLSLYILAIGGAAGLFFINMFVPVKETDYPKDQRLVETFAAKLKENTWETYVFSAKAKPVESYSTHANVHLYNIYEKDEVIHFSIQAEEKTQEYSFALDDSLRFYYAILSPDGKIVVFSGGSNTFLVYDLEKKLPRKILFSSLLNPGDSAWLSPATFSPNSSSFYISNTSQIANIGYALKKVSVSTGDMSELLQGKSPSVSPDGSWVAYIGSENSSEDKITLLNTTTGEKKPLSFKGIDKSRSFLHSNLLWTPDSQFLLFYRSQGYGKHGGGLDGILERRRTSEFVYEVSSQKVTYNREYSNNFIDDFLAFK